jgi:hypothetical protein
VTAKWGHPAEADGSGIFELGVGYLLDDDEDDEFDCTLDADAPPGSTSYVEQRGSETWCVSRFPFANLQSLRQVYASLLTDALLVHCLALEEERLIYDIEIVVAEPPSGDDEGGTIYWRVTVPGEVVSTDADTVEGNQLSWAITSLTDTLRFRVNAPEGAICPTRPCA